jgi:hypothetical protein
LRAAGIMDAMRDPMRISPVPGPGRVLVAAILLAVSMAACGAAVPSAVPASEAAAGIDALSTQLFVTNGVTPIGATERRPIVVGDVADIPWLQYLEVSRQVGLDFAGLVGRAGELRVTPIRGRQPDATAYVLVIDGRPVGAWMDAGGGSSGVVPLNGTP